MLIKKVKNDSIIQQGLLLLLGNINTFFFNFDLFFISVNFKIKKYNTFELASYIDRNWQQIKHKQINIRFPTKAEEEMNKRSKFLPLKIISLFL